jgi:hypothetical protein
MRALGKVLILVVGSILALLVIGSVQAANNRIEPDDYSEDAVLNDVNPRVQLRIYDGVIHKDFPAEFGVFPDPAVITVTANANPDIFGGYFTSTGTKTFGHSDITFSDESRQLAMHFADPTSQVTIDFIGTSTLVTEIGVLQVYSAQGALLDTFTSAPVYAHQVATLSLTRALGDIGYARAYSSPTADPFGTLDNLRFVTSLSGDYNGNGVVDAGDYVAWRKGLGTKYNQTHYQQWRQNFGVSGAGTGLGVESSVPEPAGAAYVVALGLFSIACKSRVRSGPR